MSQAELTLNYETLMVRQYETEKYFRYFRHIESVIFL